MARKPKLVGLSTPTQLKKVVDGDSLRNLQAAPVKPEGSVLPDAREADAPEARSQRVFGTAHRDDGGRPADALAPAILDAPGRIEQAAELRLSDLLKQVGLEMADSTVTREYDRPMTNLEALARRVWMHALLGGMGSQRTAEMLIERLEGKAVRGEKPATPDTTLNEQLDRTEADLINSLSPKDDK